MSKTNKQDIELKKLIIKKTSDIRHTPKDDDMDQLKKNGIDELEDDDIDELQVDDVEELGDDDDDEDMEYLEEEELFDDNNGEIAEAENDSDEIEDELIPWNDDIDEEAIDDLDDVPNVSSEDSVDDNDEDMEYLDDEEGLETDKFIDDNNGGIEDTENDTDEIEDELKLWDDDDIDEKEIDDQDDVPNVSSEDSEDSDDDDTANGFVTKALIESVRNDFLGKKTISAMKCSQHLLTSAILSIKGSDDQLHLKSPYKLEGPKMFNSVVKMCLTCVAPCLHKILGMKSINDRPQKGSKWKKLAIVIKRYLHGLITLTKLMTDATAIRRILNQGILPLLPLFKEFSLTRWALLKTLVVLWSTSEEKVRVLSVIAMFRLMKGLDNEHYDKAMKTLYMSYVKNCQFTSPSTCPSIQFMRDSLAELYTLDQTIAYSHAFIYIRQLALHLRNAMELESQERIRLIANWPYLHCLHLWAELLGKTADNSILNPLIHPLIEVCIGSMRLLKTAKFYPYIFHVCNILSDLSRKTQIYIPVADHVLQILEDRSLLTKGKKTSMKQFDWACIFKVSPSQMQESAFQDGVIQQIYNCILNFVAAHRHLISFPEITMLISKKIKDYCRKCKVSTYSKKMKQLSHKIDENAIFIQNRRKNVDFSVNDLDAIKNWEKETLEAAPHFLT